MLTHFLGEGGGKMLTVANIGGGGKNGQKCADYFMDGALAGIVTLYVVSDLSGRKEEKWQKFAILPNFPPF